jgi:hypothetical protein
MEGEQTMEHDVVLTQRDGSKKNLRIYGRPAPNAGDSVGLLVDGELVKARVREIHDAPSGILENPRSIDQVDATEMESS